MEVGGFVVVNVVNVFVGIVVGMFIVLFGGFDFE